MAPALLLLHCGSVAAAAAEAEAEAGAAAALAFAARNIHNTGATLTGKANVFVAGGKRTREVREKVDET